LINEGKAYRNDEGRRRQSMKEGKAYRNDEGCGVVSCGGQLTPQLTGALCTPESVFMVKLF